MYINNGFCKFIGKEFCNIGTTFMLLSFGQISWSTFFSQEMALAHPELDQSGKAGYNLQQILASDLVITGYPNVTSSISASVPTYCIMVPIFSSVVEYGFVFTASLVPCLSPFCSFLCITPLRVFLCSLFKCNCFRKEKVHSANSTITHGT